MPKKKVPSKPAAVKTKAPVKPVAKAAVSKAPAIKATAAKPVAKKTTIVAQVDVGWGNSLHLRGQGGGLSWDVGVLMTCKKNTEWVWTAPASAGTITFKFVRNDLHWALGPNLTVRAGATAVSTPEFPSWESLGH